MRESNKILAKNFKNPVLFFENGFGDCILNLPTIRAMASLFEGRLRFICNFDQQFLFNGITFQEVIPIRTWKDEKEEPQFNVNFVVKKIASCDCFISLVPWQSDSLIQLINKLNPDISFGFFENFDYQVDLNYKKHTSDLSFDFIKVFEPDWEFLNYVSPLNFPPFAFEQIHQLLEVIPQKFKILSVHADTLVKKMWSIEKFKKVLEKVLDENQNLIAFLFGLTNFHLNKGINADRILPCFGLSIPTSMCGVAYSNYFLGIDSCMLHVADFCGIPSVGLFGPTSSSEFGFRIGPNITIQANGDMNKIDVETVIKAVNIILKKNDVREIWKIN